MVMAVDNNAPQLKSNPSNAEQWNSFISDSAWLRKIRTLAARRLFFPKLTRLLGRAALDFLGTQMSNFLTTKTTRRKSTSGIIPRIRTRSSDSPGCLRENIAAAHKVLTAPQRPWLGNPTEPGGNGRGIKLTPIHSANSNFLMGRRSYSDVDSFSGRSSWD